MDGAIRWGYNYLPRNAGGCEDNAEHHGRRYHDSRRPGATGTVWTKRSSRRETETDLIVAWKAMGASTVDAGVQRSSGTHDWPLYAGDDHRHTPALQCRHQLYAGEPGAERPGPAAEQTLHPCDRPAGRSLADDSSRG